MLVTDQTFSDFCRELSDKEMEFSSQKVKNESTDTIRENDCISVHDSRAQCMPLPLNESVSTENENELKFDKISELEYNFHQFVNHYNKILQDIESDSSLDEVSKIHKKVYVLQTYVELMKEQNESFVNVMVELENESTRRVKQMERRLHTSAETTMNIAINLNEFDTTMHRLAQLNLDSLCVKTQTVLKKLETDSKFLRDENLNLKHDLKELLQLIHHARRTGNWDLTFSTFCYLQPEEVFGPIQALSEITCTDAFDADTALYSDDSKLKKPAHGSSMLQIQQYQRIGQSEPNVFMFGGRLFVYKPCQLAQSSSLLLDADEPRRCISVDENLFPYKQCMITKNPNCSCESSHSSLETIPLVFDREIDSVFVEPKSENISVGVQVAMKCQSTECDKRKLDEVKIQLENKFLNMEEYLLNQMNLRSVAEKKNAETESRMKEIMEEKNVLQDQKCALMIQLDNQSDCLENIKNDLQTAMQKNQAFLVQFERQSQVIKHLQEALVQSKRAYDTIKQKSSTS